MLVIKDMAEKEFKFISVGSLKPGQYVMIDDFPCVVKSIEKSKPGKHGSAKARITAVDVFTGQKRTLLKATSAETQAPIIKRGNAAVVSVSGDSVQLMDPESYEMFNAVKDSDTGKLKSGDEVEYLRFGDQVKVVRKKGEIQV